jgi:hypothetical protein
VWLVGTAVALPVLAAFFYRRRSRVVEVPAVTIWRQVGRPTDVRSIRTLLRSLASLAVQLLILALLLGALANPFATDEQARRVAVIIDCGATMQTNEAGGRTRFTAAIEAASELLRSGAVDAEVHLVFAAHRPLAAQGGKLSVPAALASLRAAKALDVESDLPAALRAAAFLREDTSATVVVISDFSGSPQSTLRSLWAGPARLSLVLVGTDQPDAGVTDVWVEPIARPRTVDLEEGLVAVRVGASVCSRGLSGRVVPVRVVADGKMAGTAELVLGDDDARVRVEVPALLQPGSAFEVQIDSGDALPVDDRAFGMMPQVRGSVCLVTRGNPSLEAALRADPRVALRVDSPERFRDPRGARVIVFDGPIATSLPAPADVRVGGYLLIASNDPLGAARLSPAPAAVGPVTHWSGGHAVLADVTPDLITIRRAFDIEPTDAFALRSLVTAGDKSLIAEAVLREEPAAPTPVPPKLIYWTFELSDTDLETRLTFPVLLWNTIDYLGSGEESEAPDDSPQRTGRAFNIDPGTELPRLLGPDHLPVELTRVGKRLVARDVVRQGLYQVLDPSGDRTVAISLLSDRGTRTLPPLEPHDAPAEPRLSLRAARSLVPDGLSWKTLAAAAVALGLVEWLLFHRRIVRVG